jgi:hypothetical protein
MSPATQSAPAAVFELVRYARTDSGSEGQWNDPASHQVNAWFEDAIRQVQKYSGLPGNWDTYGAGPLTQEVIAATTLLLSVIRSGAGGILEPFIAPTPEGYIHLEWEKGDMALEVSVIDSRTACYVVFDSDVVFDQGSLDAASFGEILPSMAFFVR